MVAQNSGEAGDDTTDHNGISVLVHPLVVLNVSEHWMREKLARGFTDFTIYGMLLGNHNGRVVEIFNSFEIIVDYGMVRTDYLVHREEQFKQICPSQVLVGWYSIGDELTSIDLSVNQQIMENTDCFLIMKFNHLEKRGERLPIKFYESVVGGDSISSIKEVRHSLADATMEHIGVDHMARMMNGPSTLAPTTTTAAAATSSASNEKPEESATADSLLTKMQAVKTLASRVKLLHDYVDAVGRGTLPVHPGRLRQIRALLARLPRNESQTDSDALGLRQATDVCLTSLLCGLTKAVEGLQAWGVKERRLAVSRARGGGQRLMSCISAAAAAAPRAVAMRSAGGGAAVGFSSDEAEEEEEELLYEEAEEQDEAGDGI